MPKQKTKGAVKKRFKITKSGKAVCSRPSRGHFHAPKNAKQARKLREPIVLTGTWARLIKQMMKG